jgi:hypothetical protein
LTLKDFMLCTTLLLAPRPALHAAPATPQPNVAAGCGEFAALVLTDGQHTYATPVVKVGNTTAGKAGLWLFHIGERQEFGRFAVSATPFDPPKGPGEAKPPGFIRTAEYPAPDLPSPRDWALVLERLKP